MKAKLNHLLLIILFSNFLLTSCKKDEVYYCSCRSSDIIAGVTYSVDTVMASSQKNAKKKCDDLDFDFGFAVQDCSLLY